MHAKAGTEEHLARKKLAFTVAVMGAVLAGMGVGGWFGGPWSVTAAMILCALASVVAGAIEGLDARSRVVMAASYLVGTVSVAAVSAWYASGRSSVANYELLIPLAIGAVPGVIAHLLFASVLKARPGRFGAGHVALVAGALLFCVGVYVTAQSTLTTEHELAVESIEENVMLVLESAVDGEIKHQGNQLDDEALRELLAQFAAEKPRGQVTVVVPRDSDPHIGVAKVLPVAMPLGLQVSSTERR